MSTIRGRRFTYLDCVHKLNQLRQRLWSFYQFRRQPSIRFMERTESYRVGEEYFRSVGGREHEPAHWRDFRLGSMPHLTAIREIIDEADMGNLNFDSLYTYATD
ncbi:hypothetical protein C2S51_010290 [Perilla frutescens var. frutescens]|nr:hypothetical protein C2S51_010290 [Perilla frutescens var. frutescens]